MQINEIVQQTGMSRRAIKYYEAEGLLRVAKDANGYRNYGENELARLKEIAVYRRLGIGVGEIRQLLEDPDKHLLETICAEKERSLSVRQKELNALRRFIENKNVDAVYSAIRYEDLAEAMQDCVPGFFGRYLTAHFLPYLQVEITTPEQQAAYERIVAFWNQVEIRVPLVLRIFYRLFGQSDPQTQAARMKEQMQRTLQPTPEEYEQLREQVRRQAVQRKKPRWKYHPIAMAQRRLMKSLQDCGYNDLFLPDMMLLSPPYREYREALAALNDRLAREIGLHYDAGFHIVVHDETPE